MQTIISILIVATLSPFTYILYVLVSNHFKNRYLQKNLPSLPILDGQKPLIGHLNILLGSKSWKNQQDGHKRLGKTYGCYLGNRRVISTIDLDFIRKFAVEDDHHDRIFTVNVSFEALEVDNLGSSQGEQWRRIRKAVAPAFSKHKVMSQNVQDEMNSVINKFVDSIELRLDRAKREKGADFIVEGMDNHLHRYTLALVLNCFYKRDDIVDLNADTNHWQTVIEDACKLLCSRITMIPLLFPMVNPVMKLITKISHPLNKIQVLLLSFIKDQIELYKRASLESKKLDGALDEAKFRMRDGTVFKGNIIDYFIGKFMDKSITEREFCHSSFLIFVASVKDIMELSSRLLYLLACNQNAQNKLRESIKSDGIESIYLKWAINETLRLFPPAHIGCSRTLTRDMESKFGIIPKDTFLNTPLWTLHRWSEYWGEDANDFKPERWVKSDTFHPLQYLPFGAGRRVCPGKEFSLINVRMLMVRLLTRFKFEKCEKTLEEPDFQTPFFIITVSKDLNWLKISRTDNLGDDI